MKILLTGATGFLGRIIAQHLNDHEVISLSRNNASLSADLTKEVPSIPVIDLVIHSAGKAHIVPRTDFEKKSFNDTNVQGTKNLLKGLDKVVDNIKGFVFISSVAVYGRSAGAMITETDMLLAKDSYGLSKIEAEGIIIKWCRKNNIQFAILRLPLVVGPNPPGNLKLMIEGIKNGYYFNIGGGQARKSVVLADDVAGIVLKAAQVGGIYNLTDGHHPSFNELGNEISRQLKKPNPRNLPIGIAKILALIGDFLGSHAPINTQKLEKITSDLTFNDDKAIQKLNWSPKRVLNEFKII